MTDVKTAMTTSTPPEKKMPRDDLKAGDNLCAHCSAKCCRYFALPIETPTERSDYEFIRWYLLHHKATVFVENEAWYLMVHTVCRYLRDDNLCGIYETRPEICREYTTDNCEYDDDWIYEQYFETPEQVNEYADAVLLPRKKQGKGKKISIRSPKPKPLNVVSFSQ